MPAAPTLRTTRLILRPWRDQDVAAFAALNADPEVMAEMGGPRSRADRRGRGPADPGALSTRMATVAGPSSYHASRASSDCIGLAVPGFEAFFTPCGEIGWRLRPGLLGPWLRDRRRGGPRSISASRSSAWERSYPSPRQPISGRGGSWSGSDVFGELRKISTIRTFRKVTPCAGMFSIVSAARSGAGPAT